MENWAKTLLYCYRYLGTIVNTIDDMVKKISLNSMYYNRKSRATTLTQINKLIELNDRKVNLTNLKVIVDTCLSELNSKDLEFVSLFYIDGLNFEQVSDALGVSLRTVFRRKSRALANITKILDSKYEKSYFMNNYKEENWLFDFYNYNEAKSKTLKIDNLSSEVYEQGKEVFKALKDLRKVAS